MFNPGVIDSLKIHARAKQFFLVGGLLVAVAMPYTPSADDAAKLAKLEKDSRWLTALWVACLVMCYYSFGFIARHAAAVADASLVTQLVVGLVALGLGQVTLSLTGGVLMAINYYFADGRYTMGYRG